MSRQPDPRNIALRDQLEAMLADVWPESLTAAQLAERVGGTRPYWVPCWGLRTGDMAECRARRLDVPFAYVHDGERDVAQLTIDAQHINPGDSESKESTPQDRIDAFLQVLGAQGRTL